MRPADDRWREEESYYLSLVRWTRAARKRAFFLIRRLGWPRLWSRRGRAYLALVAVGLGEVFDRGELRSKFIERVVLDGCLLASVIFHHCDPTRRVGGSIHTLPTHALIPLLCHALFCPHREAQQRYTRAPASAPTPNSPPLGRTPRPPMIPRRASWSLFHRLCPDRLRLAGAMLFSIVEIGAIACPAGDVSPIRKGCLAQRIRYHEIDPQPPGRSSIPQRGPSSRTYRDPLHSDRIKRADTLEEWIAAIVFNHLIAARCVSRQPVDFARTSSLRTPRSGTSYAASTLR